MRVAFAFAIAIGSLFAAPQPAAACSCAMRTAIQVLADVDAAFTGRLVAIETPLVIRSSLDPALYRFEVERVLKGAVPRNATVRSASSGASCGLEGLRVGDRYTVFARTRDGGLTAGLCDNLRPGDPDPVSGAGGVLLPPTADLPPPWALAATAAAIVLAALAASRASVRAHDERALGVGDPLAR